MIELFGGLNGYAPNDDLGPTAQVPGRDPFHVRWVPATEGTFEFFAATPMPPRQLNANHLRKVWEKSYPPIYGSGQYEGGLTHSNNRNGIAFYHSPAHPSDGDAANVLSFSLLQFDGALIGFGGSVFFEDQGRRCFSPMSAEKRFSRYLDLVKRFYSSAFDGPALNLRFGLQGVAESVLRLPNSVYKFSEPNYQDIIAYETQLTDYSAPTEEVIGGFLDHLWGSYSMDRPRA